MYFLYDHLQPGTFVTCYADTDSMALATTRTRPMKEGMTPEEELRAVFDPIVKSEMKESWEANWKKWFVTTDAVEDERFPGKLKRKFEKIASIKNFEFRRVSIYTRSIHRSGSKDVPFNRSRQWGSQNGFQGYSPYTKFEIR